MNLRHWRPARGRTLGLALVIAASWGAEALAEGKAPEISGVLETKVDAALAPGQGTGDGGPSFGAEQYANLRLKAFLGERGTIYAAANLVAATGSLVPLELSASSGSYEPAEPFVAGSGYAAALELERLYYRLEWEKASVDVGLQRLAFGYGQSFSPTDFLVSRNPLYPDARPRGSLALVASAYPEREWKARAFAVAAGGASGGTAGGAAASGNLALGTDGEGTIGGLSAEYHGAKASVQALYAIEADASGASSATHRFGLSSKIDAGPSFVVDALYTLDGDWLRTGDYYGRDWKAYRGLEASLGADYSILDGDLYLLAQYLFHGGIALASGDLGRRDYLFSEIAYIIDDYRSLALSCVAGLDDASFVPALEYSDELFQGFTLDLSCRLPLDGRSFSGRGDYGELGPVRMGTAGELAIKAKLKF